MQIILTSLSSSGTGKTTSFAHIAYLVGLAGFTVRIIELDSRNSLRQCCGLGEVDPAKSTSVIFEENFAGDYPFVPLWEEYLSEGVKILQVDRQAQRRTVDALTSQPFGVLALKKILEKHPISCDLIILDCPGEENVISDSAILTSTHLLLGVECTPKCFQDIKSFLGHLHNFRDRWGFPIPVLAGFLVGKFDLRPAYQKKAFPQLLDVAQELGCQLFNPIRWSSHYLNSYHAGLPVNVYAPTFPGGDDFSVTGNFFNRSDQMLESFDESYAQLPAVVPYLINILRPSPAKLYSQV